MKRSLFLLIFAGLFFAGTNPEEKQVKIEYEKYKLANGLDVILHIDRSDPIVALAVQYHVGSNRETEGRTGFAHLFEHMMFQRSENVPEDQFFKLIQDAGGTLNGGTSNDATTYFEVVPKNALEKILWMESDRMGFMINTVTKKSFAIQQNVVQNEKRQNYDNRPYGFTQEVVAKNLYPEGHPYNWTVIGEMEDLFNASVEDVKAFHQRFYLPNNATVVLAGDFDVDEAKKLIEKYFGEIPAGNEVKDPVPVPVKLDKTKKLYHEDNFAKAAQLRMIWPTVEQFSDDSYALSYLGQLLSQGKKAPLYKVLEKEKKLTTSQNAYNSSQEIAGSFSINVTANDGVSLKDVEEAVFEAFRMFETEGFTDEDVERIKAGQETQFYNGISSVLGKSFQLAYYNEYAGDPSYYKTDIGKTKAVTRQDILRVYEKYIKNQPYLATSFVPKGQLSLVAEGSADAGVKEESISEATQVTIEEMEEVEIAMTPTSFDRTVIPVDGPDPSVTLPEIWDTKLDNGMRVLGIENTELPLVQFNIVLKGGHYLDKMEKSGTALLLSELMMEGTKNKTPLELEEEIEKLGASINISASAIDITISANTLARNYDKTLALVEEILLEPRWDAEEFELAKSRLQNRLLRSKADPNALARDAFNKLVYGPDHIFSLDRQGNETTVPGIAIEDLKAFYELNFSPTVASFHIAGDISREKVMTSLRKLEKEWIAKDVEFPVYELPEPLPKSKIFFVDVPGAKQSVISIGCMGLSRTDEDFYPANVMNMKLGGSFSGNVNLVLREEKGFTYGARTGFSGTYIPGTFQATASVRSSATVESVEIFKRLMEEYRNGISEEDLIFTKNSINKSRARDFETLGAKNRMLQEISMYNQPLDYVRRQEQIVSDMTREEHKALAEKYIVPDRMYYVIAGDAATQMEALGQIGFGAPEAVK
ncbi:MAG TPA: pitrilysin family protein [Bacteroidales bacterium]|nr:pitrilysin family protein [Bacteroidales bacterium]HPI84857.1 pitrilysin family protein [Bacteroidales bacterium]HPM92101.1 pitrilysin family protein [Bacteroidales bacterium]